MSNFVTPIDGIMNVALNGKSFHAPIGPDGEQQGTSIKTIRANVLASRDYANYLTVADASLPVTVTIPNDKQDLMPVGTTFALMRKGAGAASFVGASGVNLVSKGIAAVGVRYGVIVCIKLADNTWMVTGDVTDGIPVPVVIPNIAFYGDSTLYGTNGAGDPPGPPRVVNPVPAQVSTKLGVTTQNKAIHGATMDEWLAGSTARGIPRTWADEMANNTAATIVIQNTGINDWDKDEGPYKAGLEAMRVAAAANGKRFIVETPNPTFQTLWGSSAEADASVAAKARWMREWAATKGVDVIDVHAGITAYFASSGTTAAQFTPDGGHPTQAGYDRIADIVASRLIALNIL